MDIVAGETFDRVVKGRPGAIECSTTRGWVFNPPRACGGVWTNGKEPKCCEVHMMPWGHARPGCVQ